MGIKNFENGPRIYLDMDGVVADFDRAMLEYGQPAKVVKMIPGVYQHLKPMPGAIEGIGHLIAHAKNRVFICTKIPDKAPWAASEKLFWIHAYLPKLMGKVFIVPDKGAVGTSKDILVDDHPHWANANDFPGTLVHYDVTHVTNGVSTPSEAAQLYPSLARVSNWVDLVDLLEAIVKGDDELAKEAKLAAISKQTATIVINARMYKTSTTITHEDIIELSEQPVSFTSYPISYTFNNSFSSGAGFLHPGQSIDVSNNSYVFHVTASTPGISFS